MRYLALQHDGATVKIGVPDVVAAAIRRAVREHRAAVPEKQWPRYVLGCVGCRRPCMAIALCACCTPTATVAPHPRLLLVDDFLERAERLLAS